ncbi:MAG: ATP-dependent DNA helicase RecG [Candidatus Doudnabacteria bacterium RIFCSPLOWO2_02_FULL_42_9]|uniref:ATP-dependent DNA helicase RecG n=1 Tax=Candidatus Doudnabacteria bacterium RIFCSPHIGHO2_01_FULL_41_86 TaxID=1817821 RepID=A0A1F5N7X7_9BACT|nr:MAG: ATP-dependent DNA helicase RecG [Candidatus Doudnabacteria bacterium RIFCSPHIGHO2_01_FULL_41_86]OGE74927.1 MAG: ATP-dependent DNA helicase RecG [Candidatus Doudnabacteria bacterium RIFCSPHIGHO2_01_43_10]OGE85785.1 MAG: ATP-dependent DNA helicase RecG [Candidatus Doudnabacteria bacterium RIFCSPHIGHO2_12_FULL_42_22]OGE87280.1 MAG: ATP-dependent DNA helicase RecG [Candidatus Doudnabacteria bacterium RIFCSPHIGHO2_02_FULL_42_25]OGE92117.1 MAG: ATP-dependent DNA helicase RecG [Candidatus Doud
MLKTPVEQLYLVGPARAKLFKKLGILTLEDLLFYFPRAHHDLSKFSEIKDLKMGEMVNIKAKILEVKTFRTKVRRFTLTQALVEDGTDSIVCIWFNQPFLTKILKPHEEFVFSGKTVVAKNKLQLQNPVYEPVKTEQIHTSRLVPLYSLTSSLTQKQLRSIIKTYLDKVVLPDYLPSDIMRKEKLFSEDRAVKTFHFPDDYASLKMAQNRLAFDEIFQTQLRVLKYKFQRQQKNSFQVKIPDNLNEKIASLPFQLTAGQTQALTVILEDFDKSFPANRLLEGDVGSGKTIVAALALWVLARNNLQCVLLSPTEVLATQHYQTLLKFFEEDGINVALLTSTQSRINNNPVTKATLISQIKSGTIPIIIGTHALLEKQVKFKKLAMIVIDEQHRFGVEQRSILKSMSNAHLLTMSATPIPRTLALTLYGDLDLSILKELPAGRLKIVTKIVAEENRAKAYKFISDQIESGRQVFVICPLIEESDKLGVKSATSEHKKLSDLFPQFQIGLLHGKLKPAQKESAMQDFKDNKLQILVATSVIEVGVDVPNASVMMIEGAERFGLAQLHQFRGRVGRGEHKSYCFLFSDDPQALSNPRLKAIEENSNGFELAEKDLQIRGSGDLYGTKQSGYDFKIATLNNLDLVERTRGYAEELLYQDLNLNHYPLLKQKIEAKPLVHLE